MRKVRPIPVTQKYKPRAFFFKDLHTCTHVFVETKSVKKPLERPFTGPYKRPATSRADPPRSEKPPQNFATEPAASSSQPVRTPAPPLRPALRTYLSKKTARKAVTLNLVANEIYAPKNLSHFLIEPANQPIPAFLQRPATTAAQLPANDSHVTRSLLVHSLPGATNSHPPQRPATSRADPPRSEKPPQNFATEPAASSSQPDKVPTKLGYSIGNPPGEIPSPDSTSSPGIIPSPGRITSPGSTSSNDRIPSPHRIPSPEITAAPVIPASPRRSNFDFHVRAIYNLERNRVKIHKTNMTDVRVMDNNEIRRYPVDYKYRSS
ncbi:proline-rich receptor-like protein kinase PERK10 [Belonocnema kinseyi]|uniref:proline-rich receptor-like protein kinase PERK10 n=1 Tax=Belonocnema kinseyi TaxID=2817044 RepID=UPI00143DBB19|nr:proline-rich receptor-like protein kinase PERK10 [Belonocnema kinseyi]